MSILSEYVRNFTREPWGATKTALGKTGGWMLRNTGATDQQITAAVQDAEDAAANALPVVQTSLYMLIKRAFPVVPDATALAIASRIAKAAVDQVDTAMSAVGEWAKANNDDPAVQ